MNNLRHSIRTLRKRPWLTGLVIGALGLGIAINSTIFTVVNSLLLAPLPYARPDELAEISRVPRSVPFAELTRARSFAGIAGFTLMNHAVGASGDVRPLLGFRSSPNLFEVLGVEAMIGRVYTTQDDPANAPAVVMLSHDYWRALSGDPKIIGQTLTIASERHTIIGVLPSEFTLLNRNASIWIPAAGTQSRFVARLGPGVTTGQAETEVRSVALALDSALATTSPDQQVQVRPVSQTFRASANDAQTLLLLQAAVGFVLIITAVNVGSLLLVQSRARQREFAIRAALGAGRTQVAGQLITESAVLTAAAAALGLFLTRMTLELIATRLPDGIAARLVAPDGLSIDYRVLVFAAVLSVGIVLLCAMASAISSWRLDLVAELRSSVSASSMNRQWLGQVLVSAEMALAIMLLIGAGLIFKGLSGLENTSLGFDPENVVRARFEPPPARYPSPEQRSRAFTELIESISTIPGVEAVGGIAPQVFPFSGAVTPISRFEAEGTDKAEVRADIFSVSPNYFKAVRVPLLQGRLLSRTDLSDGAPVVVISQAFAERYWGGESPVGRRVRLYGERADSPWISIVGVVGDVRNAARVETQRIVYRPLQQAPPIGIAVMIRATVRDPLALAPAIRSRLSAIDPVVPQYPIVDLASAVVDYNDGHRLTANLWGAFAVFGLLLASLGVYGTMRTWVGSHAAEIGIRMAIGAQRSDVIALVMRRALMSCLVGLLVGLGSALALRKIIASQLYGASPADPAVFLAVSTLIILVGLFAAFLPARAAARTDPLMSLKRD